MQPILKAVCVAILLLTAVALLMFPLRSARDGDLAMVSLYLGGEGESPGIFYDRDFDFPTGYPHYDVPVWMIQSSLAGISAALLLVLVRAQPVRSE